MIARRTPIVFGDCRFVIFALLVASCASAQLPTADDVMVLTFERSADAVDGSKPTRAEHLAYTDGHDGQGLLVADQGGTVLTYDVPSRVTAEKGAVEFWFKPNWDGGDGKLHTILTDAGGAFRLVKTTGNQVDFRMFNAAGDMIIYGDFRVRDWQANAWRHLRIEWDMKDVTYIYVDGVKRQSLQAARNWPPAAMLETFVIGGDINGGPTADGVFDTLRVWAGPPRPGEAAWAQVKADAEALHAAGGYAIDFGPADETPRPGFTRVSQDKVMQSGAAFGWTRPVESAKLSLPYHVPYGPIAPIERTFLEGDGDNAFTVNVPAGRYRVWLVTGDLRSVPPAFAVIANGKTVLSETDMAEVRVRIQFNTFDVDVEDAGLTLAFEGAPCFVVNGCVITPLDAQSAYEPVIAALRQDFEMTLPHFLERWDANEYVETNPKPRPTAAQQARGFLHFARPAMLAVYPNTIPAAGEIDQPIEAAATPGEYEPMTIGVYPLRDVSNVTATLSDLQGPSGAQIGRDAMTLRRAKYRAARTHWTMKTEYRTRPEMLFRVDGPMDMDVTQLLWINVKVPDDASAGTYTGTLTLAGAQGQPLVVPLSFEVLPFTLPRDSDRTFGMWYNDPVIVATEGAFHWEIAKKRGTLERYSERRRRDFEDMREHGMQMINLPPMHVRQQGDEVVYDASQIEQLVELGIEMGLIRRPMFSGGPSIDDIDSTLGPMVWGRTPLPAGTTWQQTSLYDADFAAKYVGGIRYLRDLARERGWPEIMIMPLDEPTSAARGKACEYICDLIHRVPGVRTFVTGQIRDDYLYPELLEKVDVACYTGLRSVPESPADVEGDWIYPNNIAFAVGDGSLARFGTGFGFWFSGLEGWAPHRYSSVQESIDTDMDDRRGDCFFTYPTSTEHVPTIRWEQVREGVDDCRYMTLLRQLTEKAEQSDRPEAQAAARASRQLVERMRQATPSMYKFSQGIAVGALGFEDEDQNQTFDREAWTGQNVPRMRRDVVAMITRLIEAM